MGALATNRCKIILEELEAEVRSLRAGPAAEDRPDVVQEASRMHLGVLGRSVPWNGTPRRTPTSTSGRNHEQGLLNPIERVFQATFSRTRKIVERKPPLDLVVSSVSVFFRHIHPWFPFLDAQRVLADLGSMREPSLLHFAIFGSSLPFLFDPRLDQTASDSFWKYTKRHIFVETAEEPSYASLEASTILTLDLSGMTNGPQVSGRLAVITKLAFNLRAVDDLVLRPSVQSDEQNSQISNPSFKQHARLFWAIYALDSFISITTRQPPGLEDHTLRYFLPTRDMAWESDRSGQHHSWSRPDDSPMSPEVKFLHLLKLLDISREVHRVYLEYLILPEGDDARALCWLEMFTEYADAIEMWLQSLASGMGLGIGSPSVSSATVMQHAYGQALAIYLNGLVEFCNQPSLALHVFDGQKDAQDRCTEGVKTIANIASSVVDSMGDQLGWPFAWSMWIAARYLLVAAFHRSTALQPQFHTLLNYIYEMGRYWQISKKYWWLLRRAEHALNMWREVVDQGVPSILASIVDLRIPTSDLEDQFRDDPVLARRKASQDTHPSADNASSTGEFGPAEMEAVNLGINHRSVFGPAGYLSETWFSMPLFASSAYQQFPGDDGSSGAGRGIGWEFSS